jgi:hypothetical protein
MPQATIRSSSRNRRPIYRYPYEDNNGLASEKYPGKITFTALRRTIETSTVDGPSIRPDTFGDTQDIRREIKKITPKVRRLETVELALPPGINFADEMQYENAELNAANFAVKGAAQAFTQANGGIGQKLRTALQSVQGSASEEFRAGRADAGELATGTLTRALGAVTGTKFGAMIGTAQVPRTHTYSMFRNVNLRSFNFNFNMLPTSSAEASEIEKIVKFFRYHMYPDTLGGSIISAFKFPTIFEIELFYGNTEIAPKILPCYLTSFNTTYNGETTSFHHDGKFTQTSISMSYQEEHNLVRDDIEEGY